jgi:hypothetical protein
MPKQNGQFVEAVKALRYLGTPVAAREMARRLTDDDDWASDFMFGLVGSPARDTGLREMKMLLIDPHFPASSRFLRTMAVMTLDPNATGDLLATAGRGRGSPSSATQIGFERQKKSRR